MVRKILNPNEGSLTLEQRIGRRIKTIRVLRGITQKELADATGMSNQTISYIEQGKSDFRIGTLKEIEKVLKCTLVLIPNEDLVQGTDGFEYCLRDDIKGATEQKAIDIEKACEWIKENFENYVDVEVSSYYTYSDKFVDDFRTFMEESHK